MPEKEGRPPRDIESVPSSVDYGSRENLQRMAVDRGDGFFIVALSMILPDGECTRAVGPRQRDRSAFLRRKVEAARISAGNGNGRGNDADEADFAALRDRIADPLPPSRERRGPSPSGDGR